MSRLLLLFLLTAAEGLVRPAAALEVPARRRDQFRDNPGHVAVPFVYDIPGIGKGYGVLGAVTNIMGGYTDVSGALIAGDATGQTVAIDSIHLIDKRLVLDAGIAGLSRASIQSFGKRGMGSSKEEHVHAEFKSLLFHGQRLTGTFWDRRIESYLQHYGGSIRLKALRDKDGVLIADAVDDPKSVFNAWAVGTTFDLTDDLSDPRRGFRLEPTLWRQDPKGNGPDTVNIDVAATAYVPFGRFSTWALHYFQSDVSVINRGLTDPARLAQETGLDCTTLTDPKERSDCQGFLDTQLAENKHGTATNLGGLSRLRSYPEGRFKGAHTRFLASEFRWNLTDEVRPFNIYLMRDIRTSIQLAFFYELGTVADTVGELWDKTRASYGTGFRLVTASGIIYRLDLATGSEGAQPSIFFNYPWGF